MHQSGIGRGKTSAVQYGLMGGQKGSNCMAPAAFSLYPEQQKVAQGACPADNWQERIIVQGPLDDQVYKNDLIQGKGSF